jgi:hypothetical protein
MRVKYENSEEWSIRDRREKKEKQEWEEDIDEKKTSIFMSVRGQKKTNHPPPKIII